MANRQSLNATFLCWKLQGAEIALIKYLQSKYFCDFVSLRTDKERSKSLPNSVQKLLLNVYDGKMRVGERLS